MEIKIDKVDSLYKLSELCFGDCFEGATGNFYMKTQQKPNNMSFDCVNLRSGAMATIEADRKVVLLKAVVTLD